MNLKSSFLPEDITIDLSDGFDRSGDIRISVYDGVRGVSAWVDREGAKKLRKHLKRALAAT